MLMLMLMVMMMMMMMMMMIEIKIGERTLVGFLVKPFKLSVYKEAD